MTAVEIIRKAVDNGYSVVLKDGGPCLRGKQPVPEALMNLVKNHRSEIVAQLNLKAEGELPPKETKKSSAELQRWLIALVKSGRVGSVMLDGVPVGIRDEAESLLGAEQAWENHTDHHRWIGRARKLREALEWPMDD